MADSTLIQQWNTKRDPEVFKEITARYAGMVYATCRRILGNASDAEDVTQECFETLVRTNKGPREHMGAWLHKVATNSCFQRIRSEERRRGREAQFADGEEGRQETEWKEIYHHVDEAIAKLPERLRIPVVAHYLENQTHVQVARTLGVSRQTITYRVGKGIELVRTSLKKRGISISAVAFATMLGTDLAEAATIPVSLTATLGKLAIATSGASATVAGTTTVSKMLIAGLGVFVLLSLTTYFRHEGSETGATEQRLEIISEIASREPFLPIEVASGSRQSDPPSPVTGATSERIDKEEFTSSPKKRPPASISGRVTDVQGYPLQGARIHIHMVGKAGDHVYLDQAVRKTYEALTGPDGTYEITTYEQFGFMKAYVTMDGYYERTGLAGSGGSLRPGQKRENMDFILRKGALFVSGTVVDHENNPVPGAYVNLQRYGETEVKLGNETMRYMGYMPHRAFYFVVSDEEGHFRMPVPKEGICDLYVSKDGCGTEFFPSLLTGTDDALLVLHPGATIEGKVEGPDGMPVEGAVVELVGRVQPSGLDPEEFRSGKGFSFGIRSARTDARGEYRIGGLGEDYLYNIEARIAKNVHPGRGESVRRLTTGDETPSLKTDVHVTAGRTTSGIDLTLSPHTGALVSGKATDPDTGKPVYPSLVWAILGDAQSGITTEVKRNGTYDLRLDLDERHSCQVGWAYLHMAGDWDGMKQNMTATFDMEPGKEYNVDLEVAALVTLPVWCVDENEEPRRGLGTDVLIRDAGRSRVFSGGTTDTDGRAKLTGIPPGKPFEVMIWDRTGGTQTIVGGSEALGGQPGETLPEMKFVCPRLGGVEGILTDAYGEIVAETRVWIKAIRRGGTSLPKGRMTSEIDGIFCRFNVIPAGRYPEVHIWRVHEDEMQVAVVQDVEIIADAVTDLGTIHLEYVSDDEAERLLGITNRKRQDETPSSSIP